MATNKLSQMSQVIENLQAEITSLTNRRDQLRSSNKTLELQRQTALEDQAAQLKTQRNNHLKTLQSEVDEIRLQSAAASEELAVIRSQLEVAHPQLEACKDKLAKLNDAVAASKLELDSTIVKVGAGEAKVVKLAEEHAEIEQKILVRENKITDLDNNIAKKSSELEAILAQINVYDGKLSELQADYDTRRIAAEDELKSVLVQTNDALIALKQLRQEEEQACQEIATARQTMAKEREALNRREAKINTAEGKILKYKQYMKL